MTILGIAALTLFPLLMAYAAFSDLFTMTISNGISIVLVGAFVVLGLMTGMSVQTVLLMHLAPGLAVLVLTFIFFVRGWIGGGDAKLAAATAVWLGWANLVEYGLDASILGAILTVAIILARRRPLPAVMLERPWIARLHRAGTGVPYGIALAIAGLSIYPDTPLFEAVMSAASRGVAG